MVDKETQDSLLALCFAWTVACITPAWAEFYPIVDTGQERCFGNRLEIEYPKSGEPFFGQDAQYRGNSPAYRDNGDGTTSDLVTGLMWQKDPGTRKTFPEAVAGASACRVGGYDDWRLPSIKELYSLICFTGEDVSPNAVAAGTSELTPFISRDYFDFVYGDLDQGERVIDSQAATSTKYVSTTMRGSETMFGVNFADGRIKGYPAGRGRRGPAKYYAYYVRGNPEYGKNDFHDNGDGTVTDRATGLMWARVDSGHRNAGEHKDGKLNWEQALRWAEELEYAGHRDWRLPNAKELQSIVDYTRSPDTTDSAAIDPVFQATPILDSHGKVNYAFYWSGTTHKREGAGSAAVYVAFGRSQGWMPGPGGKRSLLDVHGAGSQRSDPKSGDPSRFPHGRGPQGDVIGIYNMVRPVRGGKADSPQRRPELAEPPPKRPVIEPGGGGLGGSGPARPGPGQMERGPRRAGRGPRPPGPRDSSPAEFLKRRRPGGGQGVVREDEAGVTAEVVGTAAATARARADAAWQKLPPSFVFILADDMGWTGLSVASDDRMPESKSDFYQTPHLASLASDGMRFSNAYAPAPMCTPTRASLLTGKSPAQLHMTTPGPAGRSSGHRRVIPPQHVTDLPATEITIAEVLRQRNYRAAHFGKWHLGGGGPGEHGFDCHDGETGNKGPGVYTDPNPKDIFGVTSRAMSFMEDQVAAGRPFYVQLSHYAVHQPTQALRSTEEELADVPEGRKHHDVAYAAMTQDLDTSVGMVLRKIESLGIAQNTYVVFMSDNGAGGRPGSPGNQPLAGGKATLWEGGIRVPLIVRGPGIRAGSSCHESVIGYDLFPTFCELSGKRPAGSTEFEGASLAPLLLDIKGLDGLDRIHEGLIFHFPHYGRGPRQLPQSAIRIGSFKLLRCYDTGEEQLFNLAHDIGEETDLALKMPDKRKDLSAKLDAGLTRIKAQLPTVNPNYDPSEEPSRRRGRRPHRSRPGSRSRS